MEPLGTVPAVCCREWSVSSLHPVGTCGVCHRVPVVMERLARNVAEEAHDGQRDKVGEPYIGHPRRVASLLDGPYERTVAWLHDVVEDTSVGLGALREMGFPPKVTDAVDAITKRQGEALDAYCRRVAANEIAYVVKLADVRDNSDEARLGQLDEATAERLRRKYAKTRQLLAAYAAMMTAR